MFLILLRNSVFFPVKIFLLFTWFFDIILLSKRFLWKHNFRFGLSIVKKFYRRYLRPDLHCIEHLGGQVKNIYFKAWHMIFTPFILFTCCCLSHSAEILLIKLLFKQIQVVWQFVEKRLMVYHLKDRYINLIVSILYFLISDETSSSATVLNQFCIDHLFLLFLHTFFYLSTLLLCLLTCLSRKFSVAFHIGFHLVSKLLFFLLFQMLWMLVTVNKAKFSPQETLITFSKTLAWGAPYKRLSLQHEKYLKHSHSHLYPRLLPLLLFSLKHMAWLVFTHQISNWSRHLSQHFFGVSELSHTRLA